MGLSSVAVSNNRTPKLMFVVFCVSNFHVVMHVGPWGLQLFTTLMDLAFVHKTWEKWASNHVGSSGEQAKAVYESHSFLYFYTSINRYDTFLTCRSTVEGCFAD